MRRQAQVLPKRRRGAPEGTANKQAKLNPEKVKEIRRLRLEGSSYGKLAQLYGVSKTAIIRICLNRAWLHVQQ